MSGEQARVIISRDSFDAVIFDMDGVVTDTARVHTSAWKRMFDDYLTSRNEAFGEDNQPFDPVDEYLRYVDGKPRFDGARSLLESRGISLAHGTSQDGPDADTVWGLSARKQGYFLESLEETPAEAYETTLELIGELRAAGLKTGIITASRNCDQVLASAGVSGIFDTQVDGIVAAELDLPGKPAPDVFLQAAADLGVEPSRAVVVEDALSGVRAGSTGGFGLVIGVDRADHREDLLAEGADVVVDDLGEVELV